MIATASDIEWVWGVTIATRLPSRMIWIRSASSKTFGMSWLIRITGRPRSRTRLIRSSTWRVSLTPSAAVGSSMITTRRAQVAARATATPWRCPPERFSTGWAIERMPIWSSAKWRVASRRMAPLLSMRSTLPERATPAQLAAEEDVRRDVERRGDGEVLVDGLDPGPARVARRAEVHRARRRA